MLREVLAELLGEHGPMLDSFRLDVKVSHTFSNYTHSETSTVAVKAKGQFILRPVWTTAAANCSRCSKVQQPRQTAAAAANCSSRGTVFMGQGTSKA